MLLGDATALLGELLSSGKITNYALDHFNGPQTLPYAAFFQMDSDPFGADNIAYYDEPPICIELYTAKIDFALTKEIEALITAHGHYFTKLRPAWEPTERYYMTVYYIS